jgi:hypothetical protein
MHVAAAAAAAADAGQGAFDGRRTCKGRLRDREAARYELEVGQIVRMPSLVWLEAVCTIILVTSYCHRE